jgi:hypothetical protein
MSANVNTCAALAKVQLIMDSVWADSAKQKDYIANVDALTAIRENQTVRIAELENPAKNKTVTIYWPEFCSPTTQASTDVCAAGGNKPGTSCQDYALSIEREAVFSIDTLNYRTLAPTYEEALAVAFLANMQALDEYLAQQAITKLHTGKGVNLFTGSKGTVSGFETSIPAAYWNASLMGYFHLVAKKNKMTSPYVVSGTNLYEAYWNAQTNSGNADGKGAKTAFDSLKFYFDINNMSTVVGEEATFLVNKNALAFHNKAFWDWTATDAKADMFGGVGGNVGKVYKIESKNLPGVFYDVTHQIACSGNVITENFKIKFTGDIFRNPVPCNPNSTNILEFVCD